jgi:hypothetical protein
MMLRMRTTLTLDRDVSAKAKSLVKKSGRSFKQVINEALRVGLEQLATPPRAKPYRAKVYSMAVRPGHNLDNVQDLLSDIEGEDAR